MLMIVWDSDKEAGFEENLVLSLSTILETDVREAQRLDFLQGQ